MATQTYAFGVGDIYMIPLGGGVNTPVQVGACQGITFDMSWSNKPLQGREDAPVMIGRGALKVSGKIKAAKFRVKDIASIVFGATTGTSTIQQANNEGGPNGTAIPAAVTIATSAQTSSGSNVLTFTSTTGVVVGTSITVAGVPVGTVVQSLTSTTVTMSANATATISAATNVVFGPSIAAVNAATFQMDLGVINATTGIQMSPVASAPAAGEYSLINGNYLFAAADSGTPVLLSYSYMKTGGAAFTYNAQQMGARPSFMLQLSNRMQSNNPAYSAMPLTATLYCVGIDKFSFDQKNEDWVVLESDFSAAQGFGGNTVTFGGDGG